MKFSTNLEKFRKFFQIAGKCVSVKDIRPVLRCVKVSVENGEIYLVATDLDNVVKMKIEGDCLEDGSCMIPEKMVNKLLSVSDDDILSFETKDGKLIIRGDRSKFNLQVVDGDDFPDVDKFDFSKCHEVQAEYLAPAFDRTMFAIDNTNTKYSLGGVCVSCSEDTFTAVATDGRRMVMQEINASVVDGHCNDPHCTVVAPKTFGILKAMLSAEGGTVEVRVELERIYFSVGNIQLSARLIAGKFPKWENIIPNKNDRVRVNLLVETFARAVKLAQLVTTESQPGIVLNFTRGNLTLKANGSDKGESEIEIPIAYDEDEIEVKLDPAYLLQCLTVLPKEAIIDVWLKEKNSMFIESSDGFKYVLMPLS